MDAYLASSVATTSASFADEVQWNGGVALTGRAILCISKFQSRRRLVGGFLIYNNVCQLL